MIFEEAMDFVTSGWGIVAIVIISLLIGLAIAIEDEHAWQQYAADHHCRLAGTKDGGVLIGITSDGKTATVFQSDQKIYLCDGGEIRIR